MPAPGRFANSLWGYSDYVEMINKDTSGQVLSIAADAAGWCARFQAENTRDVKAVYIRWEALTSPGNVELRVETIDATTGKPTGTLYDANATKTFTPSGTPPIWQLITFDVLPTQGLTTGSDYGILLIKSGAGTTVDIRSHVARSIESELSTCLLTTATAGTRSTFAEILPSVPIMTVVFEDDVEESMGFCPFHASTDRSVFGTNSVGNKIVTVGTTIVKGIRFGQITRSGTPGNMIARIWNSATNTVVAGAEVTVDKDVLSGSTGRRIKARFPTAVSLPPGTYYVMMEQEDHTTTSGNAYKPRTGQARSSAVVPSGCHYVESTNITTVPPTFTPTTSEQANVSLILDDLLPGGMTGGGGGMEGF